MFVSNTQAPSWVAATIWIKANKRRYGWQFHVQVTKRRWKSFVDAPDDYESKSGTAWYLTRVRWGYVLCAKRCPFMLPFLNTLKFQRLLGTVPCFFDVPKPAVQKVLSPCTTGAPDGDWEISLKKTQWKVPITIWKEDCKCLPRQYHAEFIGVVNGNEKFVCWCTKVKIGWIYSRSCYNAHNHHRNQENKRANHRDDLNE